MKTIIRGNVVGTTMSPESIANRIGGGGGGITEEQLVETLANYATLEDVNSNLGEAKAYTDEVVGDIESALDELHTYAQGLINGGGA